MASPEQAKGWIGFLLPLAERGGPIVSLLLAVVLVFVTWHMLGEVKRLRALTLDVWERLMACQIELARACKPPEGR